MHTVILKTVVNTSKYFARKEPAEVDGSFFDSSESLQGPGLKANFTARLFQDGKLLKSVEQQRSKKKEGTRASR